MEKQVVVNNQLLSFLEQANGSAERVLLFLHGWRSQKEIWQPVLGRLTSPATCGTSLQAPPHAGQAYQLVSLDLPGFGQSPMPSSAWAVGDHADCVKGFIDKLELKDVVIVGHSFGGRVGIKLAAQFPEVVSKLVLVDSAGFPMDEAKKNVYKNLASLARPFFRPKFMQPFRKWIYARIGAGDYLATPALQKTFINVTTEDLSEDMKKINVPTLIVYGENDIDTPAEFGERIHKLIPNSKFQIIKNAGHFSFLDRPEEFVKVLNNFISDRIL